MKNSRQFPLFQGVGSSEMHLNLNGTQTSCGLFSFNKWRVVGVIGGRKLKTTFCYIRGRETLCNTINWGVGPGPDLAGPSVSRPTFSHPLLSLGYMVGGIAKKVNHCSREGQFSKWVLANNWFISELDHLRAFSCLLVI